MRVQSTAVFAIAMVPVVAAAQQFLPSVGPPVDPDTRFEVASVKAADAASGQMLLRMVPGRFESTNVPLGVVVRQALQKPDYQIAGAPGWIGTERYSITAKAPDGIPQSAISVMLVNLLKDRFQLATHLENREQAIFHLVVARKDGRVGPDLKASSAECQATIAARRAARPSGAAGPGDPPPSPQFDPFDPNAALPCGFWRRGLNTAAGVGRSIVDLIPMLSDFTGRPVIDKTGLPGLYDFTLKFAPQPGGAGSPFGPPPPGAPPDVDPDAPNLFTAVQEQLGLKLESARGPVEVVVIDKIDKPTLD